MHISSFSVLQWDGRRSCRRRGKQEESLVVFRAKVADSKNTDLLVVSDHAVGEIEKETAKGILES